jgi:hypothetical protein
MTALRTFSYGGGWQSTAALVLAAQGRLDYRVFVFANVRDDSEYPAAAGGEQPWKYYDLGEGWFTYNFFAKCPHRLAGARCPFYLPKQSHAGQLLAVKDGIQQMLEQLELTDDERAALEGDHDAVAALAERLADVPTPAGPTPNELGAEPAFISLTALRDSLPSGAS